MHQSLRTHVDRTVWTFYWALAEGAPAQNRQLLLEKDWAYWKEAILHDLERSTPTSAGASPVSTSCVWAMP